MFLKENRDRIIRDYDMFCLELPEAAEAITKRMDNLTAEAVLAMKYLYANMPFSDVGNYTFDTFLDFARQAVYLWDHSPYRREMPEEIFLNYVLYHRVNEEEIRPCRSLFRDCLKDRVEGRGMEDAALEVNYWCAEEVTYQYTDERTSSALDIFRRGYGRCGEESVFAVNALRSVGIPARQVYAPKWSHCDDNHAWVEVWCGGEWHYMGACEPEPVLDRGWFTNAASRAMGVRSRWFDTEEPAEDVVGRDGLDRMLNQLGRYADTKRIVVVVKDPDGNPAENAKVSAEVLNYSEFAPVAEMTTGPDGTAFLETGLGSLHICAVYHGEYGECLADTREEDHFLCVLGRAFPRNKWVDFDMYAPRESVRCSRRTTDAQEEENDLRAADAAEKCRRKRERFRPLWRDCFFRNDPELAEKLMSVLTDKDRQDALPEILMEHYEEAVPYRELYPDELFFPYIWAPRVADEVLTKWRRSILDHFGPEERKDFQRHPKQIWKWIEENIRTREDKERASVYTAPAAALKLGCAGEPSRRVLFVAIARTLGIASRLNPADGAMEYWDGETFVRVLPEDERCAHIAVRGNGNIPWTYFRNWSVARAGEEGYKPLDLRGAVWKDGVLEADVVPGRYRVLTSNRLPGGDIFARRYDFEVKSRESRTVFLELREAELSDMLYSHSIPDIPVKDRYGRGVSIAGAAGGGRKLLLWLDVGREPTEHILSELLERAENFKTCRDNLVFLVPGPQALENAALAACLETFQEAAVCYDSFAKGMEMVARSMYVPPGKLPLLVVTDGGFRGIFAAAGYSVGMADLLYRILKS